MWQVSSFCAFADPCRPRLTTSNIADLPRPELLCDEGQLRSLGVTLSGFYEQRVNQILAPGDCLVATMAGEGYELRQVQSCAAALTRSQALPGKSHLARIIQWRHFPKQNAVSIAEIPYAWRAGWSQVGSHFASVAVLEPHQPHQDHISFRSLWAYLPGISPSWGNTALSLGSSMSQLIEHTVEAVSLELPSGKRIGHTRCLVCEHAKDGPSFQGALALIVRLILGPRQSLSEAGFATRLIPASPLPTTCASS